MKTQLAQVLDGELEPSKVYADLLAEQELLEGKLDILKPLVLEELNRYTEKEVTLSGITYQKRNAPTRYDFSEVTQWKAAKYKVSAIEEFAKILSKSGNTGVDENGEIINPAKVIYGKETFAVVKKG